MKNLPEEFLQTMQEILGEDYEPFLASYDEERHFSLRINKLKTNEEDFEKTAPFQLKKIPWIQGGYYYEGTDRPAAHPFYAAGLYYLQEASAMTPASRLPVRPGDRVLDLCAAPGGKATELGARLKGQGILVANDVSRSRARALLRNIELFGISNAFVTNEKPHILAGRFPDYFDKVMVDAPCSGEGMFFRNPEVIAAWMEKGPDYFSRIQKEITVNAADMLRPGGMMLYSTCTFSPLENESVISSLLDRRPEGFTDDFQQMLYKAAELAGMTQETRRKYDKTMTTKIDIIEQREFARKQGFEEGKEQGYVEGKEQGYVEGKELGYGEGYGKGIRKVAGNMLSSGMPREQVQELTGLSGEELDTL